MKQFQVRYRQVRQHKNNRCVNQQCGKWVELYEEKTCPGCGKRSLERADKKRCDDCHTPLISGDQVCPLCGSKQRTVVELRSFSTENLTACTHLLHKAMPFLSLTECRKECRNITAENPYRISFAGKPEQVRLFIREWNALNGTAVACLSRETSRRPVVLIHSYNRRNEIKHGRLLDEAIQKSDRSLIRESTMAILHRINREEEPLRLRFTSDFDHIEEWVAAWRSLGGTAVRSPEHG